MSRTVALANGEPPRLPKQIVETPSMRRTRVAFSLTMTQRSMMLIDGPPGTGKTTAAAMLVKQARSEGFPAVYVAIPERPSPSEVLRAIIESVSGTPGCGTKHNMENEARAMLADFGGLLVVDEVQNLRRSGMQELRFLHDDSQTNVAILILGWQADKVIRDMPDLDSRVRYRAKFTPLQDEEVCEIAHSLDSRLNRTSDGVIIHINDIYARGNMRRWNSFCAAARSLLPADAPIDLPTANAIIAVLDSSALVA